MQETSYTKFNVGTGELEERQLQEVFQGKSDAEVTAKMNDRLMELEEQGHTLNRRVKLKNSYRNRPCPCGSGKKFKKCCWSSPY